MGQRKFQIAENIIIILVIWPKRKCVLESKVIHVFFDTLENIKKVFQLKSVVLKVSKLHFEKIELTISRKCLQSRKFFACKSGARKSFCRWAQTRFSENFSWVGGLRDCRHFLEMALSIFAKCTLGSFNTALFNFVNDEEWSRLPRTFVRGGHVQFSVQFQSKEQKASNA